MNSSRSKSNCRFSVVAILFVTIHIVSGSHDMYVVQSTLSDEQRGQACCRHNDFDISLQEKESGFNNANCVSGTTLFLLHEMQLTTTSDANLNAFETFPNNPSRSCLTNFSGTSDV